MIKIRTKLIPYITPAIFFLLPWQVRYIFDQQLIVGEQFEFGVISLYIVELLVVLAFIVYGRLRICRAHKKTVGFSFLILCLALISTLWAVNGAVAFGQFVHILVAMMLFLLLLDSRTNLRWVAIGFVAGLVIPIGLGLWQVIVGGSIASTWLGLAARDAQTLGDAVFALDDGTRILRAYGSFGHPNTFGGYLVIGILSLLIFPVSSLHRQGSIDRRSVIWWTAIIILLIGLIITYSQSAWIALIVGLASGVSVLIYLRHPERAKRVEGSIQTRFKLIAGAFTVLILLGSVFGVLALDRIGQGQSSITERADQYQEWPSIASDSMLLGAGFGNYTYAIEQFDQAREWWQYQPVHNAPMLIVGELGIFGLVLIGLWAASIDKLNFARLPARAPTVALMMGCALLVIAGLDHYLWTQWAGLALVVYVMALTARVE
ncbi:hypothetical protein HN358_02045 [Candidatus Uhrbacteria bacterium]|jgi:hypothetical protein|nr:hypothetical protein [Candidatus Uhrbacteria bacterium]